MKEKRRRGFIFFLILGSIVILGSVLPIAFISAPEINGTTTTEGLTTSSLSTTTTEGLTTTSLPTTINTTSILSSTTTTTNVGTTTPAPVFPRIELIDNYIDLDITENRFVYIDYNTTTFPYLLNVKKEDKNGNLIWKTEIPCLNYTLSQTLNNGITVINQNTHDIAVLTMCQNFTSNMTLSYMFKLAGNGTLIWTKEFDQFQFNNFNAISIQPIFHNDLMYFTKARTTMFNSGMFIMSLNFTNGNILDSSIILSNNTCGGGFDLNIGKRICNFKIINNNNLYVAVYSSTITPRGWCINNFDFNLNLISQTVNYDIACFDSTFDNATNTFFPSFFNSTTGDFYTLHKNRLCKYLNLSNTAIPTNWTNPFYNSSLTSLAYNLFVAGAGGSFAFDQNFGYSLFYASLGTSNITQYVSAVKIDFFNQIVTPIPSFVTSYVTNSYTTVTNWTLFASTLYNGDNTLYAGNFEFITRLAPNNKNIGLFNISVI